MTKNHLYEERITIWKAGCFDDAIGFAEKEAVKYAVDAECEYIGLAQAFHLYDENIDNGSEIFSLMREHNYTPKKYLDRYFDTEYERQQDDEQ